MLKFKSLNKYTNLLYLKYLSNLNNFVNEKLLAENQ